MSTRGSYGFHLDGQDKLAYNHSDSDPGGLGEEVLAFLRARALQKGWVGELRKQVDTLRLVDKTMTPTADDIQRLKPYTDLGVATGSTSDWYCLLRRAQGKLDVALDCGYLLANNTFIVDSLYCEYAFILNLDDETFECYEGFQEKPHPYGRYGRIKASHSVGDHYGCRLRAAFPFDDIPSDWNEQAYKGTIHPTVRDYKRYRQGRPPLRKLRVHTLPF